MISKPKTSYILLSTEAVADHTIGVELSSSTEATGGVAEMLAGWYCHLICSGVPGSNVGKKPSYCTARNQPMRLGANLVGVPFTPKTFACLNTGSGCSKPD